MNFPKDINNVMKSLEFLEYCSDDQPRDKEQATNIVENIAVKILNIPKGIYTRQVAAGVLLKINSFI